MDNILKLILIGAGVILTCVVVGVGFFISSESKNTSNAGMNQISSMNTEFQDVDLSLYDGLKISGSQVERVITKYGNQLSTEFTITVKTLGNMTTGRTYVTEISTFPDKYSTDYLNPNGSFLGEVTYDANDVLNGLIFTQQK